MGFQAYFNKKQRIITFIKQDLFPDTTKVLRDRAAVLGSLIPEHGLHAPSVWKYGDKMYNVNQHELVFALAKELKSHIEMPEWAVFVKTGTHRETLPKNPDWWYVRAASILRMAYKQGPIGVGKLRTYYGGRKNRGYQPDKFAEASGKVIRVILQQLEEAQLLKKAQVKTYKGRIATPQGASLIMKCSNELAKAKVA